MKHLLSLFCAVLVLASCNNSKPEEKKETGLLYFGDSITTDGATEATQLISLLEAKDSIPVKLSGKITNVCQKKGCWMKMDLGNNQSLRVTFKDYAFFVPKDAGGKEVIVEGYAYNDTISVEELKHYAEDAGSTKEEIEKITEPEVEFSFEANGVILKNE
jgi:hypothetical protein